MFVDFIRVLICHQPARYLGHRIRWYDRLASLTNKTRIETVDIQSWSSPRALYRGIPFLPEEGFDATLGKIKLFVNW